jgi:hypothetical protein
VGGGALCCVAETKNVVSSGKGLEGNGIAKIVLFKDSDNGLIPSDSGLSEISTECAQKRRNKSEKMVLPKM